MAPVEVGPAGTQYVRFSVNIWYDEKLREIFITSDDVKNFILSVNSNPGSKNRHENLYAKFEAMLREHDRWPDDV